MIIAEIETLSLRIPFKLGSKSDAAAWGDKDLPAADSKRGGAHTRACRSGINHGRPVVVTPFCRGVVDRPTVRPGKPAAS
jgi:hypothetical protein